MASFRCLSRILSKSLVNTVSDVISKIHLIIVFILFVIPLNTMSMKDENEVVARDIAKKKSEVIRHALCNVIHERGRLSVPLPIQGGKIPLEAFSDLISSKFYCESLEELGDSFILNRLLELRECPKGELKFQEGSYVLFELWHRKIVRSLLSDEGLLQIYTTTKSGHGYYKELALLSKKDTNLKRLPRDMRNLIWRFIIQIIDL